MTNENEIDDAREVLTKAGLFFDDFADENPKNAQTLNLNDTWGWACADGEYVPDDELPRLADLFYDYGYCGVLYWVSERRGQCKSEFHDINRFIEFVRNEEKICKEVPDNSRRAYAKRSYTIG